MKEALGVYFFYYFFISSMLRMMIVILSMDMHPRSLAEKRVRSVYSIGALADLVHVAILLFLFIGNAHYVEIHNFMLSGVNLVIGWNNYTLAFFTFCVVMLGLVGRFSVYYMHHDPHYFKFFILYYVLFIALTLLVTTRSSETVFIGWELLGISSVLLIAFYEHNKSSLIQSLRVLVIYKIADIIFYGALIYAAVHGHMDYSNLTNSGVLYAILAACLLKSSIGPWIWLPKAMEGPTPSSAIFYGGLSTHAPMFICLNLTMDGSLNHLENYQLLFLFLMIGFTLLISTSLSRLSPNVKNAIAYSSISQSCLIYIEILFGLFSIALLHMILHATVRIFEFLRSPSFLHVIHDIDQNKKKSVRSFQDNKHNRYYLFTWLYKYTFNDWVLPRVFMTFIDNFSGVNEQKITLRNLFKFANCALLLMICVEGVINFGMNFGIDPIDYGFIILSYLCVILALYNKFKPRLFFPSMLLSLAIIIDLLLEKILPELYYFNAVYLILFLILIYKSYASHRQRPPNLGGREQASSRLSFVVLIVGFSLVGIPGLITFFAWEHLQHYVIQIAPGDIINGFALLSLNTIVFFRFYYSNYLGSEKRLTKVKATIHD